MNTDLTRDKSNNTMSLNNFTIIEDLKFVVTECSNSIQFTYTGIDGNTSLIDHFIMSSNFISSVHDYFTSDSIDNLSDHIPLFITCKCVCINESDIDSAAERLPKPLWKFASKDHIDLYQLDFNNNNYIYFICHQI